MNNWIYAGPNPIIGGRVWVCLNVKSIEFDSYRFRYTLARVSELPVTKTVPLELKAQRKI